MPLNQHLNNLHIAVNTNDFMRVEELLSSGVDPNTRYLQPGDHPFGDNVYVPDVDGDDELVTVMTFAVLHLNVKMIRLLMRYGAKLTDQIETVVNQMLNEIWQNGDIDWVGYSNVFLLLSMNDIKLNDDQLETLLEELDKQVKFHKQVSDADAIPKNYQPIKALIDSINMTCPSGHPKLESVHPSIRSRINP